jgi:5-methylcytosine-specific restriction endonuclease McrA
MPSILEQRRRQALLGQGLKRCSMCRQIKSIFQFSRRKAASDGLRSNCKCCDKVYHDKYRSDPENVARELAVGRAWKRRNKEHRRKYMKRWLKENKGLMQTLRRNWHLAHKEEENAKSRERVREWEIANRERCRTRLRLRRAKERGSEGSHTEEQWLQLVALLDNRCACCRKKKKLSLDHIKPVTWGGSHYLANVQPLCRKCNSTKGDRVAVDYRPAYVRAWSHFQSYGMLESR